MKKVAFIGLGIMGFPMARHLKEKEFDLKVWNRNPEKVKQFGNEILTLEEVIKDADFVISCLGNDASVEEIQKQILPAMKKGAVWIDHTTISATLTMKLYKTCKDYRIDFLEAPVTGGQAGAENGKLTIMCGGDKEIFEKSLPILNSYALKAEYFGQIGNGQKAKMVNQICIASVLQGLAEAVSFAKRAGLDADKLFKLISGGAAGSWQMQNRHELMISENYKENFGFPVEWMVKDLDIALKEAEKIGANLEITSTINEKYKKIKQEINPRFDTSSLILLLTNKNF